MNLKEKILAVELAVQGRLDHLLDALNIEYSHHNNYTGACPVHQGDNRNAFVLYDNVDSEPIWQCFTQGCHRKFGKGIIGLVKGVKNCTTIEAINFVCKVINTPVDKLNLDREEIEKRRFTKLSQAVTTQGFRISREKFRRRLEIPARYYIDRKYSPEILEKYDVGLCVIPEKPFFNRVVAPIYSDDYKWVIGSVGRSIYEKCPKCDQYHCCKRNCPTDGLYCKWRTQKNFRKTEHLYNYWFAVESIRKSSVAIIVEGPGDVWRLAESGIENVVGIFGTSLSEQQAVKLSQAGALSLIVLLDNDKAGRIAKTAILNEYKHVFRLYFPNLLTKDVGEMSMEAVTQDIKPILEGLYARDW